MKFFCVTWFFFLLCLFQLQAQQVTMYRLILTDKGNSPYSIEHPEEFLSQKSIDRRERQKLSIDETDLPIDPAYFNALVEAGASIQTYSKWVSTIVVKVSNEAIMNTIGQLPFVENFYPVWRGYIPYDETVITSKMVLNDSLILSDDRINIYGNGFSQIKLHNGQTLHNLGFKGENITIAVLDGGFTNANNLNHLDQSKIIGVKNFTHETENPLGGTMDHGTRVLSCMLANTPGKFVGTAPMANYYLFKTEANTSEYPVEEDYWIAGLEYADSIGVDVVTSSLGYFVFDDPLMNHQLSELNGVTVPASRAASMGVSKGMVLLNSAGNEGYSSWGKIIFPSDAANVITVGSVASDSIRSSFSSLGFTSDGRVKPDVMAMGSGSTVVSAQGEITQSNGTSFSCPIMAGLTACLWQALPHLSSLELVALIREAANRYEDPNPEYGYGISNVYNAFLQGSIYVSSSPIKTSTPAIKIDSKANHIYIEADHLDYTKAYFSVYNYMGLKVLDDRLSSGVIDIRNLRKGVYIALFQYNNQKIVQKFIKQ
jgi:hypothetical protein